MTTKPHYTQERIVVTREMFPESSATSPPWFQFRLRTLLLLIVVSAVLCSAVQSIFPIVPVYTAALVGGFAGAHLAESRKSVLFAAFYAAVAGAIAACLAGGVFGAKEAFSPLSPVSPQVQPWLLPEPQIKASTFTEYAVRWTIARALSGAVLGALVGGLLGVLLGIVRRGVKKTGQ